MLRRAELESVSSQIYRICFCVTLQRSAPEAIRCNVDILFAWLAQLGERRSAEWEVTGSNLGRTNTQGLKITEKKVLHL